MVSSGSPSEESSSSMDEKEKCPVPGCQPSPCTQSESETETETETETESGESEHVSSSPQQKKSVPTSSHNKIRPPKPSSSPSVPAKSSSSAKKKRPRQQEEEKEEEEEQQVGEIEPATEKSTKVNPPKKLAPLDEVKKKSKKSNGDNQKGKISVPERGELDETKGKAKKGDGDNKKRKKSVLESAGKPSPQKSVKKSGLIWSPMDEVTFLKCVVAYLEGGHEILKNNLTPLYDYVKSLKVLDNEYTNSQLGDKFRRFRGKFEVMTDKVNGKNFNFKTPREETLYRLSNKVWGRGGEEDDEEGSAGEEDEKSEVHPVKAEMPSGREEGKSREEEEKKTGVEDIKMTQAENDDDVEMTHKGNEEEGKENEKNVELNTKENLAASVNPNPNSNPGECPSQHHVSNGSMGMVPADDVRKLMDHIREEIHEEKSMMRNEMKEMKDHLHREVEELKSNMEKLVKEEIKGFLGTSYPNDGISNKYMVSSAEMVKKMSCVRDLPQLDASDAQRFEPDWRKLHLDELAIRSKRLALLQSECQFRSEKVCTLVNQPNP